MSTTDTDTAKSGKGIPVVLPTNLKVGAVKGFEFPVSSGAGRPAVANPLIEHAKLANNNRDNTYGIAPLATDAEAEKATRLLAKAGKEIGCGFRTHYVADEKKLYFQARDAIVRPRSPESEKRTEG